MDVVIPVSCPFCIYLSSVILSEKDVWKNNMIFDFECTSGGKIFFNKKMRFLFCKKNVDYNRLICRHSNKESPIIKLYKIIHRFLEDKQIKNDHLFLCYA